MTITANNFPAAPVRARTKEYVIGGSKYIVTSAFSETAKETVENKLMKFVADRVSEDMRLARNAVF